MRTRLGGEISAMNPISYALQVGVRHDFGMGQGLGLGPGLGPGVHPWFGVFPLIGIGLSVALVAAIVFVAWKLSSYYDAAKKKL